MGKPPSEISQLDPEDFYFLQAGALWHFDFMRKDLANILTKMFSG